MDITINIILSVIAVAVPSVACFVINASWVRHLSNMNKIWKDQCNKVNKDWGEFSVDVIGSNGKLNAAIIEAWKGSLNDPDSIRESVVKIESLTKEAAESSAEIVKRITGSNPPVEKTDP